MRRLICAFVVRIWQKQVFSRTWLTWKGYSVAPAMSSAKYTIKVSLPNCTYEVHKVQMSRIVTKPTKWHVRPAKTQISLIRAFAVHLRKAMILSYPLSALRRLWSDWTDAQADLSLRWAHTCHFVGFVTMRLKCKSIVLISSSLYINYWPSDEGIFQYINMSFLYDLFDKSVRIYMTVFGGPLCTQKIWTKPSCLTN